MLLASGFSFQALYAQDVKAGPCDSIQMFYDQALVVLDSVIGNQNEMQKQLNKTRAEITKSRTEISHLVRDKNATNTELKEARKLIAEQLKKIEELEANVKRLSAPARSSKQKGT